MPCLKTILISGPSEDVSLLYKSLEEYKDEVEAKEKEPGMNLFNIYSWIKAKFSDKLPEFTEEDDDTLSYRHFIEDYLYSEEDADNKEAYLAIYTYSTWNLRMYALIKLIEVGFPKCIIHYTLRKSDKSGYYFPESWYYCDCDKSYYYMSDEDEYKTFINDYEDLCVYPFLIGQLDQSMMR